MVDAYYSGFWGAFIGAFLFTFIIGIAFYVVTCIFLNKIFEKAGVEGTWRAWVPIYNYMVFMKLGDMSPWLVLYGLAGTILLSWIGIGFIFSLALFVAGGFAASRIGMKLGQDPNLVWAWIIPLIWMIIMGNKKTRWNLDVPPASWAGNAFLADNTVWDGVPIQTPTPEVIIDVEATEFDTGNYGR